METFAQLRPFVENPRFETERKQALETLVMGNIDAPIRGVVEGFARLPCCFTLQSCFGHFVHAEAPETDNLEPLPAHDVGPVTYRIAYVALCLQNSASGRRLCSALAEVTSIDPCNVQFGSPGWFWERQINSFALQVEPSRFAFQDQATIDHSEALVVKKVRDQFFSRIGDLVHELLNEGATA